MFGSTTLAETLRGFATWSSRRRGCRSSPPRPTRRTWNISNGCGPLSTPIVAAARSLRDSLADVEVRSEIPETELSLRFGLHWGATLYIGRVLTAGRSEVTALGDEVNEAARIEACATDGRTLAAKSLIERL